MGNKLFKIPHSKGFSSKKAFSSVTSFLREFRTAKIMPRSFKSNRFKPEEALNEHLKSAEKDAYKTFFTKKNVRHKNDVSKSGLYQELKRSAFMITTRSEKANENPEDCEPADLDPLGRIDRTEANILW